MESIFTAQELARLERIQAGAWDRAMAGDLMAKERAKRMVSQGIERGGVGRKVEDIAMRFKLMAGDVMNYI